MSWLRPAMIAVDLAPEEIALEEKASRVGRSLAVVSRSLDMFRGEEIAIEAEIAEREAAHRAQMDELTEDLRQTRVSIEGFAASERILIAGAKPPVEAVEVEAAPVQRLIPRQIRSKAS